MKNLNGIEVFNLGNGKPVSVLEMVSSFEKVSGVSIPYTFSSRRNGDIANSYADINKARKILGWVAKENIMKMCDDVWRWQKNLRKNAW